MTVNIDKTKCIVFANGNLKVKPLTYDGNSLVQTYKYLGLIINRNGNFNKTIEDKIAKTKRALFILKQALSTSCNVSVRSSMSLFDKRIQPILLYGSPIWSIPSSHTHIKMTLENIPDKNTKEHISNCLNPLSLDKVNLISIRVNKAKNMITIKLDNVITKSRILNDYKKTKTPVAIPYNGSRNPKLICGECN